MNVRKMVPNEIAKFHGTRAQTQRTCVWREDNSATLRPPLNVLISRRNDKHPELHVLRSFKKKKEEKSRRALCLERKREREFGAASGWKGQEQLVRQLCGEHKIALQHVHMAEFSYVRGKQCVEQQTAS